VWVQNGRVARAEMASEIGWIRRKVVVLLHEHLVLSLIFFQDLHEAIFAVKKTDAESNFLCFIF
jgi:hypothetical protein